MASKAEQAEHAEPVEHDSATQPIADTAQPSRATVVAAASGRAPSAEGVAKLQHTIGNRAVARLVSDGRALARLKEEKTVIGEQVEVESEAERAEAERIIKKLSTTYAITVDSKKAVEAVRAGYPHAPQAVRDAIATRHWKLYELTAVEKAADAFAPILGAARATSTRATVGQEVTTVGKLNTSIDVNKATGVADTATTGEYFSKNTALGLFQGAETWGGYFNGDFKKQRIQTAAHEMAHGLLAYALPGFILATGDGDPAKAYWLDEDTRSNVAGAEAPPTSYGKTNADEDMCESFGIYVADKARLKNGDGAAAGKPGNPCPKRLAYIEAVIAGWKPPPAPVPAPPPAVAPPVPAPAAPAPAAPAPAQAKKRSVWDYTFPWRWFM